MTVQPVEMHPDVRTTLLNSVFLVGLLINWALLQRVIVHTTRSEKARTESFLEEFLHLDDQPTFTRKDQLTGHF